MSDFCLPLREPDPQAFSLCAFLRERGETLETIDQGTSELDFQDPQHPRLVTRQVIGEVSAQEVRARFLALVDESDRRGEMGEVRSLEAAAETQIPGVIHDPVLRRRILEKLATFRGGLLERGLPEGGERYQEALAHLILDYVRTPEDQVGLGIRLTSEANRPARGFDQIVLRHEANCLEYATLLTAIGRLAGLPLVVEEVFRDARGYVVEHLRVVLKDRVLDPLRGRLTVSSRDLSLPVSRLDLHSYHLGSLAFGVPEGEAGALYQQALRFAPNQYMILTNYARWLHQGDRNNREALQVLERARAANPQYPMIFVGLSNVYRALGSEEQASQADRMAERLFSAPVVETF